MNKKEMFGLGLASAAGIAGWIAVLVAIGSVMGCASVESHPAQPKAKMTPEVELRIETRNCVAKLQDGKPEAKANAFAFCSCWLEGTQKTVGHLQWKQFDGNDQAIAYQLAGYCAAKTLPTDEDDGAI